jgi:hypothetical protein
VACTEQAHLGQQVGRSRYRGRSLCSHELSLLVIPGRVRRLALELRHPPNRFIGDFGLNDAAEPSLQTCQRHRCEPVRAAQRQPPGVRTRKPSGPALRYSQIGWSGFMPASERIQVAMHPLTHHRAP